MLFAETAANQAQRMATTAIGVYCHRYGGPIPGDDRRRTLSEERDKLFRRFDELGIETTTVSYPSHRSVDEGKALRGEMRGTFTKNLLLKDKKGHFFLIVAHEDLELDLKSLHLRIGAARSLRFAPAEQMRELLKIEPGALTPLAILNDEEGLVTVVVDAGLLQAEQLNFHPLVNTESTGIRADDLLVFIASCGREALIMDLV